MTGASQSTRAGMAGMAGAVNQARAQWWVRLRARPREALALLRLGAGSITALGVLIFVFGTSWDIQWHSFIGRDRALVPPHLLMLGGILLCGVTALAEIGVESFWARSNETIADLSTPFAGAFYGSLGAYVAGFAALAAAVGFPLDVYWHALYGIDVSVWAPFHVMIITGMSIVALGAAYLLRSGANLADTTGVAGAAQAGRIGASIAAGAMICALFFYLDAAFDDAAIHLGGFQIDTYPLMVGVFGGFALALVAAAWPARFAATRVALVFYALDALAFLAIPPLTDALVVAEHQAYRHGRPTQVIVSLIWPLTLILLAGAIDLAMGFARRRGWPWERTASLVRRAAAGGTIAVAALYPIYLPISFSVARDADGRLAVVAVIAALLLGAAGGWLGGWLGLEVGSSLQGAQR